MARFSRGGALVAGGILVGLALTGCSGSSGSQAQQACRLVGRSLHTFAQSQSEAGSRADQDRGAALQDLRLALPLAALAATQSGQWQALDTTLSESSRVEEADLVAALTRECAAVGSPG